MTADPMLDGVSLLERAIGYALGSLRVITRDDLHRVTPCHGWDVGNLLAHLDDSLTTLNEAADFAQISLGGGPGGGRGIQEGDGGWDPVLVLRDRAVELLGAWAHQVRDHTVTVGGCPMAARTVAEVGAVEVAVHAWDLARACGRSRPMPAPMAADLLGRAHAFVTDADRPERFAEPIDQPWRASAEDRLLAFLGRNPCWSPPCRF